MIRLTRKQAEYVRNASHRWNIKVGAVRSGKTYLDTEYTILKRIRASSGKEGLIVLLGNTRGTLQRNILEPMQARFGSELVSNIRMDNKATLFGQDCYCLGADKISQVSKLQGATVKYCYGDEITTWSQDVFEMLKSRLSVPGACFDGTCNPTYPRHWFKRFLDSDADIYAQHYVIDDNPTLDSAYVASLKREYSGTVFYDRYILGRWTTAEGVIYKDFAHDPAPYLVDSITEPLPLVSIGIDYGANRSKTKFVAAGITAGFRAVYILAERDINGTHSPDAIYNQFEEFYRSVVARWGKCQYCFADYGALGQVITAGLSRHCKARELPVSVQDCYKGRIIDRIMLIAQLMASGRFYVVRGCDNVIAAFSEALWDSKHEDTRLDDGTSDIDTCDAVEYAIASFMDKFCLR